MKTILLHGLGQTSSSWKNTINTMGKSADILCPNLFDWFEDKEVCYQVLYLAFSEYCKQFSEPVNICGLSLGGILALQYGIENPDKINSLALRHNIQCRKNSCNFKICSFGLCLKEHLKAWDLVKRILSICQNP